MSFFGNKTGQELTFVGSPSTSAGWVVGGGFTVATTGTAADLPLGSLINTAIQLTSDLTAQPETVEYVEFPFTTPASYAVKTKVEFWMRPGVFFIASEWTVSVYQGSTRQSLSTDSAGVTYLPNASGKFTTTFDALPSTAYTVRFARPNNLGVNQGVLNVANVIVGPGIGAQGAVVGPWQPYPSAPVWTGITGTSVGKFRQIGDSMEVIVQMVSNNTTTGFTVAVPAGFTIDATKINANNINQVLGVATANDATGNLWTGNAVYGTSTTVGFFSTNSATLWGNGVSPFTWASGDVVNARFIVPIVEWANSGTLNVINDNKLSPVRAGVIMPYAGSSAPTGWQLCDGSSLSQTTYHELFSAIGTTWNTQTDPTTGSAWASPGAGNFRVPDLRGVFLRGTGTPSGLSAVTLAGFQLDDLKSHTHDLVNGRVLASLGASGANAIPVTGQTTNPTAAAYPSVVTSTGGTETRPRNVGVNYIIKLWNDSLNFAGFAEVQPGIAAGLVSASGLKGSTTGTAIATGYVGEIVEATFNQTTLSGSYQNVSNTLSLGAGIWMVYVAVTVWSSGNNTSYATLKLRNTTDSSDVFAWSVGFQSMAGDKFVPTIATYYVRPASMKVYQVQAIDPNAGSTTIVANGSLTGQNKIFAVRIA